MDSIQSLDLSMPITDIRRYTQRIDPQKSFTNLSRDCDDILECTGQLP